MKAFDEVAERALHGFVKCSDGRLYHSFIADEVLESWERKQEQARQREITRQKLSAWRAKKAHKAPENEDAARNGYVTGYETDTGNGDETDTGNPSVTSKTRTGTGTGTRKEENLSSSAMPELPLGDPAEDPEDPEKPAAPKKPKPHAYPAEFERFWAVYPRQVNKIDALKAWEKARNLAGSRAPEDAGPKEFGAEALFRAVEAFAKDRQGDPPTTCRTPPRGSTRAGGRPQWRSRPAGASTRPGTCRSGSEGGALLFSIRILDAA